MRFYNQIDSVGAGSTTIDVINASISPVPITPATLSAISTMSRQGPVQIRNMTVFNRETVNSIISQQSATNATLSEAEKRAQGIVPGIAGATLQQLTRPGLQIKPGSAEFIQQKMNMGMKFEKAVSPALITGNLGVRTVTDVVKNTTAQVTAVATGLKDSTNSLINKGIISGLEPATQIGGIIAAAGAFGNQTIGAILKDPKNVVNILSTRGTELVGKLSSGITNLTSTITGGLDKLKSVGNMISSGNFASGIADKFSSGLSGVAAGLSGAVAGAVGKFVGGLFGKSANVSIEQLFNQLKSTAQQAFARAESSFGTLKPGVPNYSGEAPTESTDTEKAVNKLDAAKIELQQAESQLLALRIDIDINYTDEIAAKLREAEVNVTRAKQKVSQAANDIISPVSKKKGGLFGRLKNPISSLKEEVQRGVSGLSNIVIQSTNSFNSMLKAVSTITTAYSTGGLSLLVNSKLGESFAKLTDPTKLVGDLTTNATNQLKNITNFSLETKLSEKANTATAKLGATLGSFGSMIKTPTFAENTDKLKTTLTAKTGQLIDSEICPLPMIISGTVGTSAQRPNEQVRTQQLALSNIVSLRAEETKQELIVEKLYIESLSTPGDAGKIKSLTDARNKLQSIRLQMAQSQEVYESIIRTG